MIFNSKQLEELESIHDSTGTFEEDAEEGATEEVGEAAMEWRRGLIEEAAESVKRAKTRPVDPAITYQVTSLLFDRESRRFARVQRSVPGYLKIGYLTGGDREYGTLDVEGYLREYGPQKKLSELAIQLGLPELEVETIADRLNITTADEDDEIVVEDPTLAAAAPVVEVPVPPRVVAPPIEFDPYEATTRFRALEDDEVEDDDAGVIDDDDAVAVDDDTEVTALKAKSAKAKPASKPKSLKLDDDDDDDVFDDDDETDDDDELIGRPTAQTRKAAPPTMSAKPKSPAKAAAPPPKNQGKSNGAVKAKTKEVAIPVKKAAKAPAPPAKVAKGKEPAKKGTGTKAKANPIDDPNTFIKENFNELSNRELARLTGLSEHTIRRKLGEWGMKRKRE